MNKLVLSLLIIFLLFEGDAVFAFGISPPWVHADRLVPGSHYEQIIYLTQGSPDKPLNVEIKIDPSETNSWFKFEPGSNFTIPEGSQQFPMKVIVDVPKDAGYETYTGRIRVRVMSGGEGQVAVLTGGIIDVRLTVSGEEFSDFEIKNVKIKDLEVDWPIKAFIKLENLGNVKVRPSKVHFDIYDKYHAEILESKDSTDINWIEPFKTGEAIAQVSTKLGVGEYWADFEIYKKGELVLKDKAYFHIFPRGTIKPYPTFLGISIYIWFAAAAVLLLITGGFKFGLWKKLLDKTGIRITIQRTKK